MSYLFSVTAQQDQLGAQQAHGAVGLGLTTYVTASLLVFICLVPTCCPQLAEQPTGLCGAQCLHPGARGS